MTGTTAAEVNGRTSDPGLLRTTGIDVLAMADAAFIPPLDCLAPRRLRRLLVPARIPPPAAVDGLPGGEIVHRPADDVSILEVAGSLREPIDAELPDSVAAVLKRGSRRIVLDLSRIPDVDAAGIGGLVRAFNLTCAAGGELRIVHARDRVRHVLRVVGLLELMTTGASLAR